MLKREKESSSKKLRGYTPAYREPHITKDRLKDQSGGREVNYNFVQESGQVLLPLLTWVAAIGLLFTLGGKSLQLISKRMESRQKAYLCLKENFSIFASLSNYLNTTNKIILSLNLIPNPKAQFLKRALIIKQNLFILRKALSLKNTNSCSWKQKAYLFHFHPIGGSIYKVSRDIHGRVILKKKPKKLIFRTTSFSIVGLLRYLPEFQLHQSKEVSSLVF